MRGHVILIKCMVGSFGAILLFCRDLQKVGPDPVSVRPELELTAMSIRGFAPSLIRTPLVDVGIHPLD